MTREEIEEKIEELGMEVLLADGFDEAFIGIGLQFHKPLAVYDMGKCLDILVTRDGMTREDAMDYLAFNVYDAYVGIQTPVFMIVMNNGGLA
jgi:hypothetical protein